MSDPAEFDQYASSYDDDLAAALAATGESKEYFAKRRIEWTAKRLRSLGQTPAHIVDFGCGMGDSYPIWAATAPNIKYTGLEVSESLLQLARTQQTSPACEFSLMSDFQESNFADIVYCNGVFHHIPPEERNRSLSIVHRVLKPGGYFALWENNPWNPGTRYVMAHCAFDRNAKTLSVLNASNLLRSNGFQIVLRDSLFLFPQALALLRPLERMFVRLPIGGQYLMFCRKAS
jgi:SAM-dependent methyltransferase